MPGWVFWPLWFAAFIAHAVQVASVATDFPDGDRRHEIYGLVIVSVMANVLLYEAAARSLHSANSAFELLIGSAVPIHVFTMPLEHRLGPKGVLITTVMALIIPLILVGASPHW